MSSVVSFFKKNYHFIIFGAFAILLGIAMFSSTAQSADQHLAVISEKSFSDAVVYGAKEASEGYVCAFFHILFIKLPALFSQLASFVCILAAVALCAAIAAGSDETTKKVNSDRFRPALIFACAFFAALSFSTLRFAIFGALGLVRYTLPETLALLFWYLTERNKEKTPRYLPAIALAAAMLSYQAALAVALLAAFDAILRARDRRFDLFTALCVALPICAFAAYPITGCLPAFPEGVSRLWSLHLFISSFLDPGGFILPLVSFFIFTAIGTLRKDIIGCFSSLSPAKRIFRLTLCVLSAAAVFILIIRSPIFTFFEISGYITIPVLSALFVMIAIRFAISFWSGEDSSSAPLFAAAIIVLAATCLTGTFGGASYYIPLMLVAALLARSFLYVSDDSVALSVAGAAAAALISFDVMSELEFLGAIAVILAVALLRLSPFFKKTRACEILAVGLAFYALFSLGSANIAEGGIKETAKQNDDRPRAISTADAPDSVDPNGIGCFRI